MCDVENLLSRSTGKSGGDRTSQSKGIWYYGIIHHMYKKKCGIEEKDLASKPGNIENMPRTCALGQN